MNDPGVVAALGIETVQWLSEGPDTITVRLSGRWPRRRPTWSGQPLLVIEALGQRHRFPAMPEPPSLSGTAPGTWRMNFSVPAGLASEGETRAWLQLGATLVPLPRDPHAASGDPSSSSSLEMRLRSAEAELQGAQARARAAEGAAGELAARLNRLERDAHELQALLSERERARREAEQRAYAEEMVRLEVARERDASNQALEHSKTELRELERTLERLRRRADEAEHAAAAAARERGGSRRGRDLARAAVLATETRSAVEVRGVPPASAPSVPLPPAPVWSEHERHMRFARAAGPSSVSAESAQLSETLEALRDELTQLRAIAERERAQRVETEAAAAELARRLHEYEARCQRAYDAIDGLREQLEAVRLAYAALVSGPVAEPAAPEPAGRLGPVERERLEAALTRLREAAPPADEPAASAPAGEPAATAPQPVKPWLGPVLRRLTEGDPTRAGELLLALLPAQAAVHPEPLSYDLVLGTERCIQVTVTDGGATKVTQADSPRDATVVAFQIVGDAAAVARLVAAGVPRRRLFRGGRRLARVQGSRVQARVLAALTDPPVTLTGLQDAGARLDAALALTLVAGMIDPAWSRGETFTLAHREPDSTHPDAALRVSDAGSLQVDVAKLSGNPDVVIVCDSEALLPLLDGRHPAGVAVEGDATALALVQRWVKRAQSG
ncbi:MAG: hypothetical protein ACJ76X_10530 [Solirubrobacteraceae bacterium]